MALPDTGITTTLVGTTLGVATRNVGNLCRSESVNKWAKNKPIQLDKVTGVTEVERQAAGYGINVQGSYDQPRGKNEYYDEPYRLGDFRGYNHQALPPVWVDIVSISGFGIPSGATAPWTLKAGSKYTIVSRFVAGEIDPYYINPKTVREKNTDVGGGYGGVAWTYRPNLTADVIVPNARVQTAGLIGGPTHSFQFTAVPYGGTGEKLRAEYVRYNGTTNNQYLTVGEEIMDPNYRSLIVIEPLALSFDHGNSPSLVYDPIENNVGYSDWIINGENVPVTVYVRAQYTHNGTGLSYDTTGADMTVAANTTVRLFNLINMQGWGVGSNSYTLSLIWLYFKDSNGNEFIVDTRTNQNLNVTVTQPI